MKNLYLAAIVSAITLMYCNSPKKSPELIPTPQETMNTELIGTNWKLVELNGQPVTNPAPNQKVANIVLMPQANNLVGSGGCNSFMGTYELQDGNRLKFSGVAMTRMACPDMTIETQLAQVIEATDNYAINGKFLMLHKAKMSPLAKFEAQ